MYLKRYIYKNDLTGHWMLDMSKKNEGRYRSSSLQRQGFRTAEAAWAEAARQIDEYCAERKGLEAMRAAIIAQDRKEYPWLYGNEERA